MGDSEIIRIFAPPEPAKPLHDAQMCGSFYYLSVMTDDSLLICYYPILSGHLIGHLSGHSSSNMSICPFICPFTFQYISPSSLSPFSPVSPSFMWLPYSLLRLPICHLFGLLHVQECQFSLDVLNRSQSFCP